MEGQRVKYIDFLKFIGLLGIFIAHVDSPDWLIQVRSFDVPLMVLLSSILARRSVSKYGEGRKESLSFVISRFMRLVFPTWILLVFFFIYKAIATKSFFSVRFYLDTFLLTRYGYGYVWIVLIYLYSAILVPAFRKTRFSFRTTLVIVLIYLLYEILYYYRIGTENRFINSTFYYIVPYGLLTYLGFNYTELSGTGKKTIITCSGIVFLLLAVFYTLKAGSFQLVGTTKYPPRLYYLSYGIFCSFSLLLLCEENRLSIFENDLIVFISKHSMWIYLWHIVVLDIYGTLKLSVIWYIKLPVIFITATVIVALVNKALDIIERNHISEFWHYLRV